MTDLVLSPTQTKAAQASPPQPNSSAAVAPAVQIVEKAKSLAAATVLHSGSRALRVMPVALYQVARLRPAGIIGASGLLAAITVALITVLSVRNTTELLQRRIAQAKLHPVSHATLTDSRDYLMSSLPTRDQMPIVVQKILQQAGAAGVTLDAGHYAYTPPKGGSVGRYEVEFPVKADYPNVRNFIDRTLTAVPAAGLDRLRVERKAVGENVVKADVRFVIFVRNGVSP